jgi:hypothetical protein
MVKDTYYHLFFQRVFTSGLWENDGSEAITTVRSKQKAPKIFGALIDIKDD